MQTTPNPSAHSSRPETNDTTRIEAGRALVDGIQIYYEVHGAEDGTPLVLLHGGGSTIDSNFDRMMPFRARTRRVIALEEQGHGRTSDRDQPAITWPRRRLRRQIKAMRRSYAEITARLLERFLADPQPA